jgi:hypothetical protein
MSDKELIILSISGLILFGISFASAVYLMFNYCEFEQIKCYWEQ